MILTIFHHSYQELSESDRELLKTSLFKWLLEYTSKNTSMDPGWCLKYNRKKRILSH